MNSASDQWVPMFAAHQKIYPRSVKGRFSKLRWMCVWLTQAVFYGIPWIEFHDRQVLLFDLVQRRFYVGGFVLHPQDFIYLTGLLICCALSLFLFTAVAGRVWCGYACPQTVYTEIFLWFEKVIEGDRQARIRLDEKKWRFAWLTKKTAKHAVWIAFAMWTGFTFVGYFTPIRTLWSELLSLNFGAWEIFWVGFYGFATYGNAGFMREQVCKYMCPYARFQSAMFDKDTLVVSYDADRGEPRGSRPKAAEPASLGLGACIDCTLCVQVCPTGIDIRKGLQYECIGCAACIDVCDQVMDKMSYPRGLIRYTTENALENKWGASEIWQQLLRPRVLIYTGIVWLVIAAVFLSLMARHEIKVDVVRDRNSLGRIVDDGLIENVYRLQIMNTTETPLDIGVELEALSNSQTVQYEPLHLLPTQSRWLPVRVQAQADLTSGSHAFYFVIKAYRMEHHQDDESDETQGPKVVDRIKEKAVFLMPRQ